MPPRSGSRLEAERAGRKAGLATAHRASLGFAGLQIRAVP